MLRDGPTQKIVSQIQITNILKMKVERNRSGQLRKRQVEFFKINEITDALRNRSCQLILKQLEIDKGNKITNALRNRPCQLILRQLESVKGNKITNALRNRSCQLIGIQEKFGKVNKTTDALRNRSIQLIRIQYACEQKLGGKRNEATIEDKKGVDQRTDHKAWQACQYPEELFQSANFVGGIWVKKI